MNPPASAFLVCFSLASSSPLLESAEPAATPTPSVAARPAREVTFYLLRYKSVEIDGGLVGLAPGTAVVKVSDKGETMLVRRGEQQFEVDKRDLTTSRGTAKKASQADTIAQDKSVAPTTCRSPWKPNGVRALRSVEAIEVLTAVDDFGRAMRRRFVIENR